MTSSGFNTTRLFSIGAPWIMATRISAACLPRSAAGDFAVLDRELLAVGDGGRDALFRQRAAGTAETATPVIAGRDVLGAGNVSDMLVAEPGQMINCDFHGFRIVNAYARHEL